MLCSNDVDATGGTFALSIGDRRRGSKEGIRKDDGRESRLRVIVHSHKPDASVCQPRIAKLMMRARSAAEGLKRSGILHQEQAIASLGKRFNYLQKIQHEANEEIFKSVPVHVCLGNLNTNTAFVEESALGCDWFSLLMCL